MTPEDNHDAPQDNKDQNVVQPFAIDENKVIRTIVLGSHWQDVLMTLIGEEGLDPLDIDIVKLADSFKRYLEQIQKFDFKMPSRFILVAAILLRMKAEQILDEEEQKKEKTQTLPQINIENIPSLMAPIVRKTTRRVTLDELVLALNKTLEFKERKEGKTLRMRRAVERLIGDEEDIEVKIEKVFHTVREKKSTTFSELTAGMTVRQTVDIFLPLLYLSNRGKINCDQEEMFKEIFIKLREVQAA